MTQTDLYRSITGDKETHHRTIAAELAKQPATHRRLIALYATGLTDRQVGLSTHRAYGAARGMLIRTMHAVHKRIHGLPRYHVKGRAKGQPRRRQEISQAARDAISRAVESVDEAHSFRDFLTPEERARV